MHNKSIAELAAGLRGGAFSSQELIRGFLDRIAKLDPQLNTLITLTEASALEQAAAADRRLASGEAAALTGIPFLHKDIFCTLGVRTSCGSRMLDNFEAPYDATVTAKLKQAGAVMLGKTNMDEFAMGSSNETSFYGPVRNPWDLERVPGGSSGGSAAAVAARCALGATGTDTGGSIRQPASFCGIVGMKPTYGLVSRYGLIAFASSLDQAGPIARTVEDAAILLTSMAGHDPKDSTSLELPKTDFAKACGASVKGLRVKMVNHGGGDGMPEAIEALWRQGVAWLKDAGCEIVEISLPHTKYALPTYYIVAPAEASSNLARYDGMRYGLRVDGESLADTYAKSRAAGFGPEVQRRILIGTYVLSAGYYDAYYLKAQKVRRRIRDDFEAAWESCDAILTPTAPSAAFAHGDKGDDPVAMYLNDIFTVTANLAGIPGVSVPAALDADGLPLGLQVLAPALEEERMFALASALEKAAAFDATPERWW